jgi:hypothetical protein
LWNYVIAHFETFLNELELLSTTRSDGESKANRVARSLFSAYFPDQTFDSRCYAIVGSYGKGTAARPRSDIDIIFVLPDEDFARINALEGNKQSQLLQEVKYSLLDTFPNTDIRGDGPVVKVPFSSYYFEVAPVFRLRDNKGFLTAHTKNGGSWQYTNPAAEIKWLRDVDAATTAKASHLVKMLKAWKRECNVEMKSICLETAAIYFVQQWYWRLQTIYYYDWMVRDFFASLLQFTIQGWARPAGINEQIPLGDCWQSKCQSAYNRAVKACEYERNDQDDLAVLEWQKIFGPQFKGTQSSLTVLLSGIGA